MLSPRSPSSWARAELEKSVPQHAPYDTTPPTTTTPLRNPGSHDPQDELSQDEALEQLAAFSILARWIDQGELER